MVMSIYVTLIARVALQNSDFFWSFMEQFANQSRVQVRAVGLIPWLLW